MRSALLQTTALSLSDGATITIDDSRLARRIATTTSAIDTGLADLDQLIAIADRAASPPFDVRALDGRLADMASAAERRESGNDLFTLIAMLLDRLFPSAEGSLPPGSVELALTIAGAGLLVVVLVILLRGVRERVRREAVLPEAQAEAAVSAAAQLDAAERAARAGDPRAALHAFYRYAILTLAERRLVRYEPSLTDRELLERAASLPHVETLRELISLHDRAWFGLKGATDEEASRARALAERAVA